MDAGPERATAALQRSFPTLGGFEEVPRVVSDLAFRRLASSTSDASHLNFGGTPTGEVRRTTLLRGWANSDQRAIERAVRMAATVFPGASKGTKCPAPGKNRKSRLVKVCSIPSAQDGGLMGSSSPHRTTVGTCMGGLAGRLPPAGSLLRIGPGTSRSLPGSPRVERRSPRSPRTPSGARCPCCPPSGRRSAASTARPCPGCSRRARGTTPARGSGRTRPRVGRRAPGTSRRWPGGAG
jgi:hypothetical protein